MSGQEPDKSPDTEATASGQIGEYHISVRKYQIPNVNRLLRHCWIDLELTAAIPSHAAIYFNQTEQLMAQHDYWERHVAFPERRREKIFNNRVVGCFKSRPQDVFELLEHGMSGNLDKEAVVHDNARMTYEQLFGSVEIAAIGLQKAGVTTGSRVGLLLNNSTEYVALIFAVLRLGAIVVPLNVRESPNEIQYILNDCGAEYLVYHHKLEDRVPSNDVLTSMRKTIMIPDSGEPFSVFETAASKLPEVKANEQDIAIILYTSGTTGKPKGAMISHINFIHSVMHYQFAMQMTKDDRSILTVPMSHVTGLVGLVGTVLSVGATLIIMSEFSADKFIKLISKERMTHTVIVPAMFNLCLINPDFQKANLSSWRVSGYGGAIMPEETLAKITKAIPSLKLINCYGATETTSPAAMMPPQYAAERIDQVGLPVPCSEIFVADKNGCEVEPGNLGEIWISGAMVVSGYWNNLEATNKEFVGGFWRSGDIGSIDDKGFLKIVDRIKDVINRGGYKVFASEVENVILGFPGVVESAVVASPCPVLGERVHGFVVLNEKINTAELQDYCRTRLADYKVPEKIEVLNALPRNANGKILKRSLRSHSA